MTRITGEGVPSTDPKPSFDQCKPYVDAALKTGSSPQEEESSSNSQAGVGDSPPDQNSDEDDDKTGEQDSGEGDGSKEDTDGNSKDDSDEDGDTKEGEHNLFPEYITAHSHGQTNNMDIQLLLLSRY